MFRLIAKVMLLAVIVLPFTAKIAVAGWEKTFGGTDWDAGYSVAQTEDGGHIIAGHTYSYGAGYADVWLIKTNSAGDTIWTKTFGGTDFDHAYSVAQTSDNGYIIAGSTRPYGTLADVWLIKINSVGDTTWTKLIGGTNEEDKGYSVAQTLDGGYIIAGRKQYGPEKSDVWLIKTNSKGDTLWTKTYGDGCGTSVAQTSDGGYIIASITSLYDGKSDVWLIRTNSAGDTVWTKVYGGTDFDYGYSVVQTTDGGYIITGCTESYGAGDYDVYLIKVDAYGVEESKSEIRMTNDEILKIYPNPFTRTTEIRIQKTEDRNESDIWHLASGICIYDLAGRLVKSFPLRGEGRGEPPTQQLNNSMNSITQVWDGSDDSGEPLPSGIYFCRLSIADKTITKQILLLK